MNSSLVFVLLLVGIVMCANIVQTYIKRRKEEPEANEELAETLTKIELLEERIQVLERIITENKFDLKEEIDSL
jgi:hypothetical protein